MTSSVLKKIEIRHLEIDDARSVAHLIKQLSKNIVDPENLEERIRQMSVSTALYGNHICFVAIADGKVVGFNEAVFYTIPSKGLVAQIEEFIVDMRYRSQGIGTELFRRLLRSLRDKKIGQMRLTTSNPVAQHICKKFGFILEDGEGLFVRNCHPKKSS